MVKLTIPDVPDLYSRQQRYCRIPPDKSEVFFRRPTSSPAPPLSASMEISDRSGHPADGAVNQDVHHLPSATPLPHDIVQNIPLSGRRRDLGLYDPIATGGPDDRRDLKALAGVCVEIGDVGRDRVAPKGIPQRCPLVRGLRGQVRPDHLPKDHFEIKGPADYRRYHVVSLP